MNLNLLNPIILMDHRMVGFIISMVVIVISISAIIFKYKIRHHNDKDKDNK